MSGMPGRCASLYLVLVAISAGSLLAASAGDVVINELFVSANTLYDKSEFIELYNKTGAAIDLSGWVLTGVEYDEICQEHHHQFPPGTSIAANGYLIIARDVHDATYNDAFEDIFGFLPNLEMYDASQTSYEIDDLRVANTICQNPDSYDDQIRLIPGNGDYGGSCPEGNLHYNYEALWLYADASRTQLIDAVEYKDPYWCQTDHCTGVGASDTDAFDEFPGFDDNVSIGRDASSTDTGNSLDDLYIQTPTPGAINNVNLPPDVWNLGYSPCVPDSLDDVTVSCYIKDPDGVQWARCVYKFFDGPWDSVAMTALPSDSLYSGDVPAASDSTHTQFFVKAADNTGLVRMYPDTTVDNPYRYRVGLIPIFEVQYAEIGNDTSRFVGEAVNITGVVTATRGIYYNDAIFTVQDGRGPFSGIHVFDPSYSVDAQEGDSVTVSGFISEYYGLTELYLFPDCYTEHGPGFTPLTTVVSTGNIATSSNLAERYEGVLVEVQNVTVGNPDLGYGEWDINDGSGAAVVGDDAYYAYDPVAGDPLAKVIGTLNYAYDAFKLEPRRSADIVGPPSLWTLVYSPIPPTSAGPVTISVTAVDYNYSITSVKVFYSTNGGASWDSTAMSSPDSVYSGDIGTFPDGTTVDYYIEAWNDGGYSSHKPAEGSYDLYVGLKSIAEVQGTFKSDGDSSAFAGEAVNLTGIVTAAPGEYSTNYFFIQSPYSPGENPAYSGIKVYDRTGTVTLSRGDEVYVCGDIWEYFNETELALHFSGAVAVNSTGNDVPNPYAQSTASIPAEDWEGVLVIAECATVTDEPDQFGEWKITNATPADTCRVGDSGAYTYEPVQSDQVSVTGVVMYAYGLYTLEPRDDSDIGVWAGVQDGVEPLRLALKISPNPVTSGADIKLAIPVAGKASLKVFDVQGRLVKTLLDEKIAAGEHAIHWGGSNANGRRVASGIYFMKMETRKGSVVKKMVISR
jgi:hypothetical protein